MKIQYHETISDLQKRIELHQKYGLKDIDAWMLQTLPLEPGIKILDVGCGSGKQCFSFHTHLNGKAEIVGADLNQDLLGQARETNRKMGDPVKFITLDFNKPFDIGENIYDLVSCCFAIYYAEDIPHTIFEMHKVLKPGGRLFTTGPMPNNKQLFYDIIQTATGRPIPPMPGSSRYSTQIFSTVKNLFTSAEIHVLENPLVFDTVVPFIEYTRASLNEDRKLWNSLFQSKDEYEQIISAVTEEASRRLSQEGKLVMTKVVGGIVAIK